MPAVEGDSGTLQKEIEIYQCFPSWLLLSVPYLTKSACSKLVKIVYVFLQKL